jgi:malate dehydrogenase
LLAENGAIFALQGKALDGCAHPDVKVLVVGNPCNTNCLIAAANAPRLKRSHFHALTRLDENRARALLAKKAGVSIEDVQRLIIWGNHSSTQVPDFENALIEGQSAAQRLDREWLENDFVSGVQKRGAQVIAARGKSSAASAANAALEAARDLCTPTAAGRLYSSGTLSEGNPYGVAEGIVFSFPCKTLENGEIQIVKDLPWSDFLRKKIEITQAELLEERRLCRTAGSI